MIDTKGIGEQVMREAAEGRLSKQVLAALLAPEQRLAFLSACTAIEKQYTENCTASGDPCLESGCALEGEVCLQPVQRAEAEFQRACGTAWLEILESAH